MSAVLAIAWIVVVIVVGWATRPGPHVERESTAPARGRSLRNRREARRAADRVQSELPDVVDLFALAVGAGHNVALALTATAPRAPVAWRASLVVAADAVARGDRVGDALASVVDALGDGARPLVGALASAARYGTPLQPVLERLAIEARAHRRRHAEEAARRLPITLLFPLVLCVLPAFALLSLAPAIAGALRLLRL